MYQDILTATVVTASITIAIYWMIKPLFKKKKKDSNACPGCDQCFPKEQE